MIEVEGVTKILYGGDYNPEQWPEEIWEEDMRLLKLAHVDIVTLNVFNWALLQPEENTYDFTRLDKIMRLVKENGKKVFLATSTGAHPAWMARKHPDILRTMHNGMKRKYGRRHNSCPNSPTYRKYAKALVEQIAKRYQAYDNIVAWHVSNEYGGICYCENCERAFRSWLKRKYGTLEKLNEAWNMNFWSHTLYAWEDVVVPNLLSEEFEKNGIRTTFQGISLDYARFNSDSMLECYQMEKEILNKYTPHIPVTTNFMGMYKQLDYQKWSKSLDFAGWDNYPEYFDKPSDIAMRHDLMRGLKQGKPFALLEQTPSVNNWHDICRLKRPGVMRLWSYQAVARGADTIMFFQMRQSRGACEKFHSAVISHAGHENTRQFREIAQLGEELENKLGNSILGSRLKSQIAIVFDWDNWWASSFSAGPSTRIDYVEEVTQYYKGLYEQNYSVDMISTEDDLSAYKLVIIPMLYLCKEKFAEKLRAYVKRGGTLLSTYFSGYVEEHDLVVCGGYPGKLRDILGIWVEETDALVEGESNSFWYRGRRYPAELLCDVIHLETAEEISSYGTDFYAGFPVVTKNTFGKGKAYYVGTRSGEDFYHAFLKDICEELQIRQVADTPKGVEATLRQKEGESFLFLLNHTEQTQLVRLEQDGVELLTKRQYKAGEPIALAAAAVAIIQGIQKGKEKVASPATEG